MINEAKEIKESAGVVKANGVPQVPMLLFISDGSGGTGFDEKHGEVFLKNTFQNQIMPYILSWIALIMYMIICMKR